MLTFEEASHTYRLDGAVIPSVTTLLDKLHSFADVPEEVLAAARERGTAAHKACHYWDEGDLDEAMLDAQTAGYLAGWKAFIAESGAKFTAIEAMGSHPLHRYAGTVDRLGVIAGLDWVIDIKTAAASHPMWDLQTSAYAHLFGKPSAKRATVQLRPDGNYKFCEWKDPAAWPTFLSLVTLWNWGAKHA